MTKIKAFYENGCVKAKFNGKTYNTNVRVAFEEYHFHYEDDKMIMNYNIYTKRRGGEYFVHIEESAKKEGASAVSYILPLTDEQFYKLENTYEQLVFKGKSKKYVHNVMCYLIDMFED